MSDRRVSPDGLWVQLEDPLLRVGVEPKLFGAKKVERIALPAIGTELRTAERFGEVETDKAVIDLYAPCSGKVVERNTRLESEPALAQRDPLGEGWLLLVAGEMPSYRGRAS